MRAGKLRHRIIIEKPTQNRDDNGGATPGAFATLATIWASVEPLNGKEVQSGNAQSAQVSHRVTLRARDDFDASYRFNFGGRILNIASITNFEERGIYQECMCTEVTT